MTDTASDVPKMKILYVEDEPVIRNEMAFVLEIEGYVVHTAENGQQGWEQYQSLQPDVVITDLKMPIMTGIEMLKLIRADQTRRVGVIVISGYSSGKWVEDAESLDLDAYMTKPFSLDALLKSLDELSAQ